MARIIWSPRAADDLEKIIEYIAGDSPARAKHFARRIVNRIDDLPKHPFIGAIVSEDESGRFREVLVGNYRIIYSVVGEDIRLVTIRHAARLFEPRDLDK